MRTLIYRCDKCGKITDECQSLTYEEFMNLINEADCFISNPLKIHQDIDLCDDCKKQIFNVTRFILQVKRYK